MPVTQEKDTAKEIAKVLDEATTTLDQNVLDRLVESRQQAVSVLASRASSTESSGGALRLFADYVHYHRGLTTTAGLCAAVLIAFLATQHMTGPGASEQGDAFLLSSELPPEAYADKGFDTWLAQNSH